jgi:hypothetical protein
MDTPQGLQANKEIAPDLQAYWGDSKNSANSIQTLPYLKCIALKKGISIHQTDSGFLVSKWSMSKHLSTHEELIKFLNKTGVLV